jgi:N-acyl-D-aspartate/D-glutamate deacylase
MGASARTRDVAPSGAVDRLHRERPEVASDLPAAAKRLVPRADGYVATVVAGGVIMEQGGDTGAHPGTSIRGAR